MKICRVVVCSTVWVLNTVVGSDVVSTVVVPAAWTLPTTAVANRTPATRQAASPANCNGFLTTEENTLRRTCMRTFLAARLGGVAPRLLERLVRIDLERARRRG